MVSGGPKLTRALTSSYPGPTGQIAVMARQGAVNILYRSGGRRRQGSGSPNARLIAEYDNTGQPVPGRGGYATG